MLTRRLLRSGKTGRRRSDRHVPKAKKKHSFAQYEKELQNALKKKRQLQAEKRKRKETETITEPIETNAPERPIRVATKKAIREIGKVSRYERSILDFLDYGSESSVESSSEYKESIGYESGTEGSITTHKSIRSEQESIASKRTDVLDYKFPVVPTYIPRQHRNTRQTSNNKKLMRMTPKAFRQRCQKQCIFTRRSIFRHQQRITCHQ